MDWIKQNWFKVAILILVLSGWYWYSWRPDQIRAGCHDSAVNADRVANEADRRPYLAPVSRYELNYERCLTDQGLKK